MDAKKKFKLVDSLYLCMIILPFIVGMALKILFTPASEGTNIVGAMVYFSIPMPLMDLVITESQINSALVMVALFGLCLYLTHGLTVRPQSKRQLAAEWIVEKVQNLVDENMGERFKNYSPFIAAIMGLSAFSSLACLVGLYSPTSDMNVVAGWAILVFILITYYKLQGGLLNYLKGYIEPVPLFLPCNIIGEFAAPVSMSFRHYGNVLSGSVIATLVGAALGGISESLLGWLPGVLGDIPFLRIGIPAVLSMYFDIFSGLMQAFIFAMLTMLNISLNFPEEAYERRMAKRKKKALHAA